MGYLFLTGATGLLGSYLIRDLTNKGIRLAVHVRSNRFESARERIEALMERWEKQAGYALPRPVVLEGSLGDPDLGLGARDRQWVADNCTAFMHNAASLTFHADSPDGEPWRSNTIGVKNVLEFCRRAGIREFHHVSTAYVCGKRRERILESELDCGQEHGNDYEVSKFQSELLVRQADFIDDLTVYRPAIILGDSQTGYTATFHGFYVPLKLVATLIKKTAGIDAPREMVVAGIQLASMRLRQVMQLTGDESKNFVPVDWVSEVMARIYVDRSLHGKTYHLTPAKRVKVALFQEIMEKMFLKYTELTSTAKETRVDWSEFEKFFLDGMGVYRSYWGDDPDFDATNTTAAAPDLPCPELDETTFGRMCKYAIEVNFGWPRTPPKRLNVNLESHLQPLLETDSTDAVNSTPTSSPPEPGRAPVFLGLQVNGEGGGEWELTLREGQIVSAAQGLSSRCTARYYLNSTTFGRLMSGEATASDAIGQGRVLIEGNGVPLPQLAQILDNVAKGNAQAKS